MRLGQSGKPASFVGVLVWATICMMAPVCGERSFKRKTDLEEKMMVSILDLVSSGNLQDNPMEMPKGPLGTCFQNYEFSRIAIWNIGDNKTMQDDENGIELYTDISLLDTRSQKENLETLSYIESK